MYFARWFGNVLEGAGSFRVNRRTFMMPNLQQYMTIKDAAEYLGVTPNTLRNWGAAEKITEYRHPVNNYRLYKADDLDDLLQQLEQSGSSPRNKRTRKRRAAK
jgi:excisionase family DNA binding protein